MEVLTYHSYISVFLVLLLSNSYVGANTVNLDVGLTCHFTLNNAETFYKVDVIEQPSGQPCDVSEMDSECVDDLINREILKKHCEKHPPNPSDETNKRVRMSCKFFESFDGKVCCSLSGQEKCHDFVPERPKYTDGGLNVILIMTAILVVVVVCLVIAIIIIIILACRLKKVHTQYKLSQADETSKHAALTPGNYSKKDADTSKRQSGPPPPPPLPVESDGDKTKQQPSAAGPPPPPVYVQDTDESDESDGSLKSASDTEKEKLLGDKGKKESETTVRHRHK